MTFDRAAGWTPDRACRWVETHLKARDLVRTACRATRHRMHARLAQVLDDLVFDELNHLECPRYAGLCHDAVDAAAVEFVAVPSGFADVEPPRHGEAGGGAAAARGQGGARLGDRPARPAPARPAAPGIAAPVAGRGPGQLPRSTS